MVEMEEGDEPWLPCLRFHGASGYEFGLAIGRRFQRVIRSRFASDPALNSEMLPFAETEDGEKLVAALTAANQCVSHPCPVFTAHLQLSCRIDIAELRCPEFVNMLSICVCLHELARTPSGETLEAPSKNLLGIVRPWYSMMQATVPCLLR
jgi:hypothetical protein